MRGGKREKVQGGTQATQLPTALEVRLKNLATFPDALPASRLLWLRCPLLPRSLLATDSTMLCSLGLRAADAG